MELAFVWLKTPQARILGEDGGRMLSPWWEVGPAVGKQRRGCVLPTGHDMGLKHCPTWSPDLLPKI